MRISRVVTAVCAAGLISSSILAEVPQTVSYQGRLTTSAGTAVPNGSYSVRFSLWSDATLGTESWSETQMVSVTDGLFSTELGSISGGFFDISVCPPYCDAWLQIEVTISGSIVTMTPRTHLSASPWSLVSRSYHSETSNGAQRGKGVVKGVGGGTNPTQVLVFEGDADGDGHADFSLNDSVSTSSTNRSIGHDLNSDGNPDVVVASSVDATSAHFEVGDKPTQTQFGTLIDSYVNKIDDRALLGLRSLNGLPPGTPVENNIALETNGDSASITLRSLNGLPPGTPWIDNMRFTTDATHSHHVMRGGMSGSTTGTIRMAATPDSASSVIESDADGDGIAEARRLVLVNGSVGSSSKLALQRYGGGVLIHEASTEVNAIESRDILKSYFETGDIPTQERLVNSSGSYTRAINTKGTGAVLRTAMEATDTAKMTIDVDVDGDGKKESHANLAAVLNGNVVIGCATDSNDDGNDDNSAGFTVTPTTSSVAINTKGTGADKGRTIGLGTYPDSAVQVISSDEDGDGISETSVKLSNGAALLGGVMPGGAVLSARTDANDDGIPDNTAALIVTPTTSSVAINTKGTGADKGRTISLGTYPDSAAQVISSDEDGDGHREVSIETRLQNLGLLAPSAVHRLIADSDDDGLEDVTAEMAITPTKSSLAIKTKGTSAQRYSSGGDCDDTNASLHTDCDSDGDGIVDGSVEVKSNTGGSSTIIKGGMSGSTTATIRMQTTPDSTVLDVGYHGSTTGTIRMMASSSGLDNPIEHSSGAHLTPGGTWTNASDKNLKENFEQIDATEILEKIEELPIAEWNYKAEGDDIKHIGPTAQDFKDAFGLGGNDKSISTIDPSGVALVAIKELTRQNKDLKKQNTELAKQLTDLQKQVAKLVESVKK